MGLVGAMKIITCVKQVPLSERIRLSPSGMNRDFTDVAFGLSKCDRVAVEEALRIKESRGSEVLVLSLGPPEVVEQIRRCLALGADHGVVIIDPNWLERDCLSTAKALVNQITELGADLVLTGSTSEDQANSAVGAMMATYLGWACVTEVFELALGENEGLAQRGNIKEIGSETVAFDLPAVITCNEELNHPRYPSLKGILSARKQEIPAISCTSFPPQIQLESLELVTLTRRNCVLGSGSDVVSSLLDALYGAGALDRDCS